MEQLLAVPPKPEDKERRALQFPEEMYTVSGFLSPSSKHYEKSKRFDEEIEKITLDRKYSRDLNLKSLRKFSPEWPLVDPDENLNQQEKIRLEKYQSLRSSSLPFLKESLEEETDPSLRRALLHRIIENSSPEEKREILNDPRYTATTISSPLYLRYPELEKKAATVRKMFGKSGSETFLLGGSLKDTLIIRRISPGAFTAWKKAYEDWEAWEIAEFDYVPIEPIQSYRLTKEGFVDVASGTLDISLYEWRRLFPDIYKAELDALQGSIEETLATMHVEHGHPHPGNFVLRFFRETDGKIDLSRCPRLYLIDFDRAYLH